MTARRPGSDAATDGRSHDDVAPRGSLGLRDRGRLAEGAFADLVLFDADRVRDTATYEAPHRFTEGIASVVVNGTVAWETGRDSIERAGRVLRHG